MQIFHERSYLSQESIISYNLGFAASRLTFLAKLTALRKTFESSTSFKLSASCTPDKWEIAPASLWIVGG